MNKEIIIIPTAIFLIVIGLCGCLESLTSDNTIEIDVSGVGTIQTVNELNKDVILSVSGVDCEVTVSKNTNLIEIDLSGVNCIVKVSNDHSFSSDISGSGSKIIYYD